MKLELYSGKFLDSDIEKDFEKKGLYDKTTSLANDWYELQDCEPIDENMQDTIDKLEHLERDCKYGTAVELFDLSQLFEQSENVKKIIESADKKLKELQRTNPSKAQKLNQLLEQAHVSDEKLNEAIIQRSDMDKEIERKRIENERKYRESSYSSYDSVSKSIDRDFKRKFDELAQADKARAALREAEADLNILAQLEVVDPDDSIAISDALTSFVGIYQEQIAKYQAVLGPNSKSFDAINLKNQQARIEAKIEELKAKFNAEVELEDLAHETKSAEIEETFNLSVEAEQEAKLQEERKEKTEIDSKSRAEQERKTREDADKRAKSEEAKLEAERKAKAQAEEKARVKEEKRLEEKKASELAKAESRIKVENERKAENAKNVANHNKAINIANNEKQSLSAQELETIQLVEESLRKTFGEGFDITRLRIESEQDYRKGLLEKFGLENSKDISDIQKKLNDMIYEGNILRADINTPQGLRKYQLFKQTIPNFESLKSKVIQIRGYGLEFENKLFEGLDVKNITYDDILYRADNIIEEQTKKEEQAKSKTLGAKPSDEKRKSMAEEMEARKNSPEYQQMMKEAEQENLRRQQRKEEKKGMGIGARPQKMYAQNQQEMTKPKEKSIRDEVGDEFKQQSQAELQKRKETEARWMNSMEIMDAKALQFRSYIADEKNMQERLAKLREKNLQEKNIKIQEENDKIEEGRG